MKIAHAGHAELLVNNLEASKKFFTKTMGLFITEEDATSVYLRAWQDWEHHTLILRKSEKSALVHLGWRVESPESLEQYARTTLCKRGMKVMSRLLRLSSTIPATMGRW